MKTADFKSFHYLENGDVQFSILDTIKSQNTLDVGVYLLGYNQRSETVTIKCDPFYETVKDCSFSDKNKLDAYFDAFFREDVKAQINNLGFYHKVGVLMYGKEGTGKSTIIRYYCDKFIKNNNALIFFINDYFLSQYTDFISSVRRVQDNPIIIVIEEMESLVEHNESRLKVLLDGNKSLDNCITFATTNYIDKIPAALKDRKSRFKFSIDIEGIQSEAVVEGIITKMISSICSEKDIKSFAKEMSGSTVDQIKQFCLDKLMDLEYYDSTKKSIGFNK